MEHSTNIIYNSFLINDRANSYRIPSQNEENNFFSTSNAAIELQNEEEFPQSTNKDTFLGDDRFFEDSFEDFSFNFNSGFKSCFDPDLNDSIRDLNIFQGWKSAQENRDNLKDVDNPKVYKVQSDDTGNIQQMASNLNTVSSSDKEAAEKQVYQYIESVIENGLKSSSVRAGRPKQEFDTSSEALSKFYNDYVINLQYLIEKNFSRKRSDTFRNTIFSYLKKLSIKLREISCSISEPKSKKLDVFLDAFLAPFVNWFLPYIDTNYLGESKTNLFLYFICICYPEDKCKRIIKTWVDQGTLSKEKSSHILLSLKLRKGKSKKEMSKFISSNPWFGVYSKQICDKLDCKKFDEQAALMVQDFRYSPEK